MHGNLRLILIAIHLTGAYPLWRFWKANRQTSLLHTTVWTVTAWASWGICLAPGLPHSLALYLPLCMTSCAGMAVLGARRPGVGAWNFVVGALLAALLLPIAEGRGEVYLSGPQVAFLVATLAVIGFNFGLTRLGLTALALTLGCGGLLLVLQGVIPSALEEHIQTGGLALVVLSPWFAFGQMTPRRRNLSEFDRVWLDFRDRFGMTWALRLREQFNRSALNAGWNVRLGWSRLRNDADKLAVEQAIKEQATMVLRALIKRFGSEDVSVPNHDQ